MKVKNSVKYELAYTYKELFMSSNILYIDEYSVEFSSGRVCITLNIDFIASRLCRIEDYFGAEVFKKCQQRIYEALKKYRKDKERK